MLLICIILSQLFNRVTSTKILSDVMRRTPLSSNSISIAVEPNADALSTAAEMASRNDEQSVDSTCFALESVYHKLISRWYSRLLPSVRLGGLELPEVSRAAIVLSSFGPKYLCKGWRDSSDEASIEGPNCGFPAHHHTWVLQTVPLECRKGWERYGDDAVRNIVQNVAKAHINCVQLVPPSDWSLFFNTSQLGTHILDYQYMVRSDQWDTSETASIKGLDLDHLQRLARSWATTRNQHFVAWMNLLDVFYLGFDVTRSATLPILLSYFFLWTGDDDDPDSVEASDVFPSSAPPILTGRLCDILHRASVTLLPELAKWVCFKGGEASKAQGKRVMQRVLTALHDLIALRFKESTDIVDPNVVAATKSMELFYRINDKFPMVPLDSFINPEINDHLNLREDFPRWKMRDGFAFCAYPFILSPSTKTEVLRIESVLLMRGELQNAFFRSLFLGMQSPYLELIIRRGSLVQDVLQQLRDKNAYELRKQLRVQFVGEVGVDEGGVQKELFHLLFRDLFDENYGMFKAGEGAYGKGVVWFRWNPSVTPDLLEEYELIGRIVGLAIYNSKLLDAPLTLDDLREIDLDLANGLEELRTFQGNVEETYCRTFEVEVVDFGVRQSFELIPNGKAMALTAENRAQYIACCVDFYLNKLVQENFVAFRKGFDSATKESALKKLFKPEELLHVVVGDEDLDFAALEQQTIYDGGYDANSPAVEYFWELVHVMTPEEKKKLLFFTTGSDRAPVGGLGRLPFVIARNGPDSERLPTAHTCFNVLLLPDYSSKEKLAKLLQIAMMNIEGFGLI